MRSSRRRVVGALVGIGLSLAVLAVAEPAGAKAAPITKMTFKLDSHNVASGQAVTGSVLVQARDGHEWVALAAASLSVQVDGTEVATLTTDADGKATVSYTPTADGDHVMKVVFAGDDTHKRAQRAQGFVVGASGTGPGTS